MLFAEITLLLLLVRILPFLDVMFTSPVKALMLLFITTLPFEVTFISGLSKPWKLTAMALALTAYLGSM